MYSSESNRKSHRRLRKPWRITLKLLAVVAVAKLPASAGAIPAAAYAETMQPQINTQIKEPDSAAVHAETMQPQISTQIKKTDSDTAHVETMQPQINIQIKQPDADLELPGITSKETGEVKYVTSTTPVLFSTTPPSGSVHEAEKRERVIAFETTGEYTRVTTMQGKTGYVLSSKLCDSEEDIWDDVNYVRYAGSDDVSVLDSIGGNTIGKLQRGSEVSVTGENTTDYYRVSYDGAAGYIAKDSVVDTVPAEPASEPEPAQEPESLSSTGGGWNGAVLSPSAGAVQGPSGKETYYNLNMSGVVSLMSAYGYTASDYWVRDDGVKMLGQYVMCAANLTLRPRGTLVESSVGTAIVCDTGGFAANNPTQLDIATAW